VEEDSLLKLFHHSIDMILYYVNTLILCYSISSLKNLEVLNISDNELPEGLPNNIFTSLLSLRKLNMYQC